MYGSVGSAETVEHQADSQSKRSTGLFSCDRIIAVQIVGWEFMTNHLQLIPENTRMEANGEGAAFDISASATRTFLCRLTVTEQIEQESLDVSIWGSADGETWSKKPLLMLPQQFYRGSTKLILDLSLRAETKFIRARWELFRWGRVAPTPMFVAGLELEQIPPMSRETPTTRIALATK